MIRTLALTLLVGMALPLSAPAQSHLYDGETIDAKIEFLRNLRRKGYASLAKEFADQLIKTADKAQLPALNLEQARTAVALAKEKGPSLRMKLLDDARAAFEPFLKSNPNSPAGAQARLEVAGLYSMQAQMRLNKAYAGEDEETREKGAKEARDLYDDADREFVAAIKILKDINRYKDAVLAEFDRALNLIDKASAFINIDNPVQNRKRSETVDAARKIFAEFAKDRETTNGLLANAFLAKCYQELQDPPKVAEHNLIVESAKGAAAMPAQRLALYYDILYDKSRPNFKGDRDGRLKSVIDRSNGWFKKYPFARKSKEGEELRFEQAASYLAFARGMTDGFTKAKYDKMKQNFKDKSTFDSHLNNADKIAKELVSDGGDFGERGAYLHNTIERIRIRLESSKALASFDSAFLSATDKFYEAGAAKDADAPKLFRDGLALLRNAILLGEKEGVPAGKMHDAQFLRGRAFLSVHDLRRSAISFEALARSIPPSKKGAEAASLAMELYKRFADDDHDATARLYLRDLGAFILSPTMQRLWDGEPVIGAARYNLAMDYYAQEKYKEALDHLEKMPKSSLGYAYAQGQAVFIALSARKMADTADERKPWTQAAKAALARIGALPTAADPSTTLMWLDASMEGPKFLYADAAEFLVADKVKEASACYDEMAKSIAAIEAVFAKEGGKLAADKKSRVGFTIEVIEKYSRLGAAKVEYHKGNYEKILDDKMLGGLVKEIYEKGAGNPKADIPVVDVPVVGESLSLVLRAFIQLNRLDPAKGAYGLLMRIKAASGEAQDNTQFTRELIKDLAKQVQDMKDKNETAKLKVMVSKFTAFGDVLAKSLIYDNKNFDARDIKNLAGFYASLDEFKKAADLFKVVPEPKFLNQKSLKATEQQEKELGNYWSLQLEYGNLLRKSKEYEKANKVYSDMMNHPNARGQLFAKKEQIHIYEDRESYGNAIKFWQGFMADLNRAGIGQDKTRQELYFDAYYSTALCFYKYSQLPKTIKDNKSDYYLSQAAGLVHRLETGDGLGWQFAGPRFVAFMEKEKKLKAAYETLKKKGK